MRKGVGAELQNLSSSVGSQRRRVIYECSCDTFKKVRRKERLKEGARGRAAPGRTIGEEEITNCDATASVTDCDATATEASRCRSGKAEPKSDPSFVHGTTRSKRHLQRGLERDSL